MDNFVSSQDGLSFLRTRCEQQGLAHFLQRYGHEADATLADAVFKRFRIDIILQDLHEETASPEFPSILLTYAFLCAKLKSAEILITGITHGSWSWNRFPL